jgi:GNAT superfamily N-acetyltransferase
MVKGMRRLDKSQERAFSLRIAGDPKTACAHYAIDFQGASVWKTRDSRAYLVVIPDPNPEVHIIGAGELAEIHEFLRPLALDTKILMSKHQYAKLAHLVMARSMRVIELYTGEAGTAPSGLPPPDPSFDVREVLYSDMPLIQTMPRESAFLFSGYSEPRDLVARSAACGAFNGTQVVSMATVEMGRSFANTQVFTMPKLRGKGLATLCVASVLDRLRPTGERPLFCIRAENGSPERSIARRFGMELSGELAQVERKFMAE